jgi:hypothetical protein
MQCPLAPSQKDGSFELKGAMPPKLKNKSLGLKEAQEYAANALARDMAIAMLECWYRTGYKRANALMPHVQIDENFEEVAAIPGWQEQKGPRNGYVMLTTLFVGTLTPCILQIDYRKKCWGGLTGRQLHQQVRKQLQLEPKESLRMIPARPWYRYVVTGDPIPEHRAILANDVERSHLLGTTLLWTAYVRRSTDPDDDERARSFREAG